MNAAARKQPKDENPTEALLRSAQEAVTSGVRLSSMASGLALLMLVGILFLDIPIWRLDGLAASEGLAPSNWLRVTDVFMALSVYGVLLATRRYGAETAGRAAMLAWAAVVVATTAVVAALSPQLEPGDMPSARFAAVFSLSWFCGHLVGAHMFDLARTTLWWRAPLVGALWAFFLQSGFFFTGQFLGTDVPWPNWMMTDLMIKGAMAVAFLPIYASLRKSIPPRPGYGGR
ncbi:MAG: hypothetical protein AAFV51_02355 [Pseudomonadota bacterium]